MLIRLAVLAAVLVFAFLATELIVPRQAADRLRADLEKNGTVRKLEVRAFPALKLLFGRADRVTVEMDTLKTTGTGRIAELIDQSDRTDRLDATVSTLTVGPLVVRDASVAKRGDLISGEARVTPDDIAAAVPFGAVEVTPVVGDDGALVLEGSAPVFGTRVGVRARVSATDGAIVAAADGLLGGLGSITVFRDPRVRVDAVGASERADGFVVTAEGRLI